MFRLRQYYSVLRNALLLAENQLRRKLLLFTGVILLVAGCWGGTFTSVDQLYATIAQPLHLPIRQSLDDAFGPYTAPLSPISETPELLTVFSSTQPESLRKGRSLYEQHCMQCHGYSGVGDGPSAKMMWPKPRDFHRGIFKFTSTTGLQKATRTDLLETLERGIPGTYMTSFKLLSEADRSLIVDYVLQLGWRGEVERRLVDEAWAAGFTAEDWQSIQSKNASEADFQREAETFVEQELQQLLNDYARQVLSKWEQAAIPDAQVIPSVQRPAQFSPSLANPEVSSVENGRMLYLSDAAQCVSCHGMQGKGDGPQTQQVHKRPDGSLYSEPGLHDDWGLLTTPRNLKSGVYGGGNHPMDLFRRIHAGIKGSPMPMYGGKALTDEQIWDLVNFILMLPELRQLDVPIPTPG